MAAQRAAGRHFNRKAGQAVVSGQVHQAAPCLPLISIIFFSLSPHFSLLVPLHLSRSLSLPQLPPPKNYSPLITFFPRDPSFATCVSKLSISDIFSYDALSSYGVTDMGTWP